MENFEKAMEVVENANLETFIEKVKQLPAYSAYEHIVKEKKDGNTTRFLQMSVMLMAMRNDELSMMMHSVSLDLLFAMVDQKLKNDILNEENN